VIGYFFIWKSLKQLATQDEDTWVRSAAVEELAGNYKDDPDTLPILKRATQDEDSDVRNTALEELARNYKDGVTLRLI
jgi:HEAT repeat protein